MPSQLHLNAKLISSRQFIVGQGGHNLCMGHKSFTNYLWPKEFLAWLRMLKMIDESESSAKIHLNNGLDMPQFSIGTLTRLTHTRMNV